MPLSKHCLFVAFVFAILLTSGCATQKYPFRPLYSVKGSAKSAAHGIHSHGLNENLFQIYQKEVDEAVGELNRSHAQTQIKVHRIFSARNQKVLDLLLDFARNSSTASSSVLVDKAVAEKLRQSISLHPVVGTASSSLYNSLEVGYCFGRAAYVHFKLSQMLVPQNDIVKIFGFGQLRHSGSMWNYHMATMVRGVDSQNGQLVWWVIDDLFGEVLRVEDWMRQVSNFSILRDLSDLRFYTTDPRKFQPAFGEYQEFDMQHTEFKGYFFDLQKYFGL
jgi:hypothetical protein